MSPIIVGVSAHFHDSACCLLRDGQLVAAAQEERFTRFKHDPALPKAAMRYCLAEAGLTIADIDAVAYYEDPVKKLDRQQRSQARASRGATDGPSLAGAIWGFSPPRPLYSSCTQSL